MDPSTFETLSPSRYITFTFPQPLLPNLLLRIAVLDSPAAAPSSSSEVAAIWVPPGRETDWVFSTKSGHLQLLLSSSTTSEPPIARLIILGNSPPYPYPTPYNSNHHSSPPKNIQQELAPLLLALTPKSYFLEVLPEIPFLIYEDGLVQSSILEICEGPFVGEMLIENVELEIFDSGVSHSEFRRRLRFKRMPNLVQTQIRIRPKNGSVFEDLENVDFDLDTEELVHPYLGPMVAGISVISSFLEGRITNGFRPRALCFGVGGGALLGFLSSRLGFEVVGVEEDEIVLSIAKKYFGLEDNELIRLHVGDGIEFVERLDEDLNVEKKFDVIMVDLDSSDATTDVCAPPMDLFRKSFLRAASMVLGEQGVLIINTIPRTDSYCESLVSEFHGNFEEFYEISVGNGENFVLIAKKSNLENVLEAHNTSFLDKLKLVVSTSYIESIRKI